MCQSERDVFAISTSVLDLKSASYSVTNWAFLCIQYKQSTIHSGESLLALQRDAISKHESSAVRLHLRKDNSGDSRWSGEARSLALGSRSLPSCQLMLCPQGRHLSRPAVWEQCQLRLSVLWFTTKPPFPHGCETKAGGFPLRITLGLGKGLKSRMEGRGTPGTW